MRRSIGIGAAAALGVLLLLGLIMGAGGPGSGNGPLLRLASPTEEASAPPAPVAAGDASDDEARPELVTSAKKPANGKSTEMIAFYANWGEEGLASLERNAADIDVLMPMWYHLGDDLTLTFDDRHAKQVADIIKRKNPDMKVMPIVNNYNKATESWNAPVIGKAIADPAKRKAIAKHIVETIDKAGYDGINIDFESFKEPDRGNLVAFMKELYPLANRAGLEVSMDVIVGSKAYDHKRLADNVDYMIPMMYDEHWKTSGSGPISSIPWFDRTIQRFFGQVPPEKVVIALGTYAYDWADTGERAKSLSFSDALALSRAKEKPMRLGGPALNSSFSYKDGNISHDVWVLDAPSMFNHISVASGHNVRGYAIWRLGVEDPALWNVLPNRDALDAETAGSLRTEKRDITYDEKRGLITEAVTR